MDLKKKYDINSILKDKTPFFHIIEEDLVNFADFLSLVNCGMGLAGLDIEDFKSIIVGQNTVDFRTHSGENLSKTAIEICEVLSEGSKALCIITTNKLPENSKEIEGIFDLIKDKLNVDWFFWNVYETEQTVRYKIYVLITD